MMIRLLFFCLLFSINSLIAQDALNMELEGQFHRGDTRYSGCWTYIDDAGAEYALLGAKTGTAAYSIDGTIEERGFVSGPESNWREITVLDHYAYITTEGNSDSTGLQIIDLQFLPDSLHLVNTFDSTFTRGHILQRDNYSDAPYIYVNGTQETDGVHILDVSDPENPIEIGLYEPGYYIHDCFVKGDLLFACAFYESTVDILDISDRSNPVLITRLDHFDGNTHSAWLTEDDRFLVVSSELDGKPARVYNVEDFNNITEVADYTANNLSLTHNPYIRGDYVFFSHNTEGIRVVDIADPMSPVEVGYYDTWDGASGGFHGLWSACPFLPSGRIIGGNREDGLYVWSFNNASACRLYGFVINAETQEQFSNVAVVVLETNDTLYTDFAGNFTFGALPGTYTLSVEVEGFAPYTTTVDMTDCEAFTLGFLLIEDDTDSAVDLYEKLPQLEISPNPSSGLVEIDFNNIEEGSSVLVYNALGHVVFSHKLENIPNHSLDLNALPSGHYQMILYDKSSLPMARAMLVLIP